MNFDSKKFNENTTSLDRLLEQKIITDKLNEEVNTPPSINKSVEFGPGFYRERVLTQVRVVLNGIGMLMTR